MNFNKILILGSTYLTQLIVDRLQQSKYELVGYVESRRTPVSGNIDLPIVDFNVEYDIALCLQYDKFIPNPKNIYNLHTGLLPNYGGLDILRHTVKEGAVEQGMTFHKMGKTYDYGPIISKITYPVIDTDTVKDLYFKQCSIAPNFVLSCLKLLEAMDEEDIDKCFVKEPRILEREFQKTPFELSKKEKLFLENNI